MSTVVVIHKVNGELVDASKQNQMVGMTDEYLQDVQRYGIIMFDASFVTNKGQERVTAYEYFE